MARKSIGATYQRERKKKRYTQKLTAETKERIKDKPAKAPSKSVLNSGGGSRVGTTVKNESRDKVKSVIKKAITHEVKPVSQPHLNQSLGGRVGTKTERKPLQLKTYDSGLTKREQGLKYKYKQSGTNNQFQIRGKEFSNAVKAGTFTTKFSDKEKSNVAKNIQKEYEKNHKSNGRAFMAGLTGSDSNVKTRTKAITGKDIDLSKVTKKGAYKAGNVTQEVASYFIAPEEAVAGKIGSKLVEKSAAKILQKGAKNLTRKEAKAMLKEAAAKDAIKEIGGKGIAKASTKKANSKALSEAVKVISDKEVKKAVEKAGKEVVESKAKRQLARRGGDILANAPLNAKYSVDHATDEKGNVDWKAAGKDLALNTAMDVGIGGTIDAVTGKVRRAKALSSEKVAKYERKISGGKEREEIKRLAKPKEEAKGFQAVGTKAKQGKTASNTGVLDEGGIIKRQFDNIDKLENTKKITSREAKKERKALTQAVQNRTGRTGFAYRSEKGVRFGNATTKGVEHIDNSTFGRKLGFEKRFEGRANRLAKPSPEARAARAETRRIADFEAERARAVREERTANTAYNKEREPLDRYDLGNRDEENRVAERVRYGKTNKEAYADEVARAQGAAKSKAAEKRRDVAIRKVLDKYMGGKDVAWSQDVIEPVKKYIKDGDENALWRSIREQMPDFYAEKPYVARIKQGYGRGSKRYVTKSRTMVEAGATSKDLDSMTNSLVEELKEAAAKAEPKAGADIKMPERKSRLAETDNVYDETPRTEDLYPDARKEVAQEAEKQETTARPQETAQSSKTAITAEETPKPNNEPTRAEKGVKQSNIPETREAMKHISRKEKPSGQAKTLLKEARRKFVDSMYSLESDAKKWAKVTGNKEYADAMLAEINNVRQAATQAAHSFAEEQINFNYEAVGESGQAIIQDINKKGTFEDVQSYLYYLNHADRLDAAKDSKLNKLIEQYKELEESGASPARLREIEDKMDELNDGTFGLNGETGNKRLFDDLTAEDARAKANELARENPEIVQDADRIVQYFRNDLRSQVQSGLISEETAEHYMKTYPNYVPAHRADFGTGLDAKTTINPNPDALRAKGSGRNLLPIDEQMKMSTQYTFQQGANNNLKMLLAERAGMAKDTVELLEQEGKEVDPLDIATFYDADRATIKYYDNGKLKTIDLSGIEDGKEIVKDLIDQAKNGVSDPLARGVLNLLGKANRGFKALITSYSLPFMVKNFFRDVPEGALQSEGTRGYLKNLFGADNSLRSIINNDDWYKAYIRTGGSSAQFLDPIKLFNDSKWSKLNPINKIERINEITEQIPRMAEFKNSLQRMGVTPTTATPNQLRRAATAAADVTVNFGRGGSLGRLFNKSFIPFFNPAIQGGDKLIRVVLRDKNAGALFKLATKAAVLGVAPTAVNEMLLADNPHYQDISDRDKMANYYIPLSKGNPLGKLMGSDGEIFLKIPKARALSIGGVLEQKFTNKLPDTSWADIVTFGSDQVGPVGWQNNIFQQILNSQITDNSATGRTWYGSNIETEYDQKDAKGRERAAHKRYDANTSAISIGITKALSKAGVEVSPKKLDYLIDSYTGIAGDVALNATRKAARRGLIASNFTTDSVLQANTQTRYYNKLKDPKTSDKELKQMGTWQSRISTVNKSIRALQDSNTEGKAEKVKELTKIRNSLMKKALSGKTNDSATGDMKAIAKVVGNKKAFDLVASEKDKEVLKRYGKADAKFLDSYIAVKELNTGSKSKTATALAIASAGGNKKIAKAFGVNAKSGDDMVSPIERAKSYLKNGGSIEEYKRLQKAIKNSKDKSNDGYMTKALALARAGASNRAFNLYDIKDYKVQQARNMASLGITQADIAKAKKAADSDGSGRVNKAEAMAYINSLKGDKAKKSVTLEGIYWYARKYGNPYGHVNASAKDATDSKTKAKYGIGKPAKSEGEAGPVPLKRGYQTVNGKKKPNGKTIGSIGEKVKLPAGMTADELKANEKLPDGDPRKVKKTTVEERMHNAFGSRIGDTTKKKVYKASMFKKIKKNKDGSSDITFANGEVWHNPVEKKVEDKTKLETSGGGGGGRRGWRRYGRRRGRGGRGGGGGGAAGGVKTLKAATPAPAMKANLTLKGYKKPNPKTIDDKVQAGLTRAQMRALLKRSKVEQATTPVRKRSTKKDVYSVRSSKK